VRDVEADEGARDFLQSELALELVDGIARALFGRLAGEPCLLEQMSRILLGQIDQLSFRTPLRYEEPGALERLLDDRAVLDLERQHQLVRTLLQQPIRAGEIALEHCGIRNAVDILDELMIAGEQLSPANTQERDHCVVSVARIADHVAIAALDLHDDGRLLHLFQMREDVA